MYTKLVVGDTHLGLYKDSSVWHNVTIELFKQVVDTCIRNNIDTIYHLGDFFDNRKTLNTKTVETAIKIANILKDITVNIIVGNHDTYYKNQVRPNSLQIFKKYKNIHIIDEPYRIDEDILIPWGCGIPKTTAKYCYGHFDISGFYMNNAYISKNGMDVNTLKGFNKVYSGHFHIPSVQYNTQYIGSPFQQNFNDIDSTRGYYCIDEDGCGFFTEFTNYPYFVRIEPSVLDNISVPIESLITGNIVKLVFKEDYGTKKNNEIIDGCLSYKPLQLNTSFDVVVIDDESDITLEDPDNLLSTVSIIKEYISKKVKTPENINKATLINMTNKLIKEVE